MSFDYQIEGYLKNQEHFIGCFPADELPSNPPKGSSLIVNYSPAGDGGTHWVAMRNLGTHNAQYFDSYGFEPDSEDMILKTKTEFKKYMKHHSIGKYKYNNVNIQSLYSDVCGEYASKFIKDGLPIDDGRINHKWLSYVRSSSADENDKRIRREIKLRHI